MLADLASELDGQDPLSLRVAGIAPAHVLSDDHSHDDGEAPDDCPACDSKSVALAFALFIRRLGGNVKEIKFLDNGEPQILIMWGDKWQIVGPGAAFGEQ